MSLRRWCDNSSFRLRIWLLVSPLYLVLFLCLGGFGLGFYRASQGFATATSIEKASRARTWPALNAAFKEFDEKLAQKLITKAEFDSRVEVASAARRRAREPDFLRSAAARRDAMRWGVFAGLSIGVLFAATPVLLFGCVFPLIQGVRAKAHLRRLGYPFVGHETEWVRIVLGERVFSAPAADELAAIPGHDASPKSLIRFVGEHFPRSKFALLSFLPAYLVLYSITLLSFGQLFFGRRRFRYRLWRVPEVLEVDAALLTALPLILIIALTLALLGYRDGTRDRALVRGAVAHTLAALLAVTVYLTVI